MKRKCLYYTPERGILCLIYANAEYNILIPSGTDKSGNCNRDVTNERKCDMFKDKNK